MKKIYLAIPYTGMEQSSYEQSKLATAAIMKEGNNVISPILQGHPLTKEGLDIPGDWEYWRDLAHQYIDWCDEVWVVIPKEGMNKVEDSAGVQGEIEYAEDTGKAVKYIRTKQEISVSSVKL